MKLNSITMHTSGSASPISARWDGGKEVAANELAS
jgi:hypothetical protein